MLNKALFVSVIIPSYNRALMLDETLASFISQDYPLDRFELIVSDNNSTDNTKEVVLKCQQRSSVIVKYIFEPRQGVHYARNTAAQGASGEVFYFTDDDMIADPALLKNIVAGFSFGQNVGVVGGKVLPKWEVPPPRWILEQCQNGYLSLTGRGEKLIVAPYDVGVFSCHEAIRRDVFLKSGGFNPENTAGEWIGDGETGLHLKIQEMGCEFVYTADAVIYHMIPPARMTQHYLNKRMANQGNCNAYTEYRKYRSTAFGLLTKMIWGLLAVGAAFLSYAPLWFILKKTDWHVSWARGFYHWNKLKYNFRLLVDPKFREIVLRMNWLDQTVIVSKD